MVAACESLPPWAGGRMGGRKRTDPPTSTCDVPELPVISSLQGRKETVHVHVYMYTHIHLRSTYWGIHVCTCILGPIMNLKLATHFKLGWLSASYNLVNSHFKMGWLALCWPAWLAMLSWQLVFKPVSYTSWIASLKQVLFLFLPERYLAPSYQGNQGAQNQAWS